MAYDPKNLTEEQFAALISFSDPLALALAVGIPSDAIVEHVRTVLAQNEVQQAAERLRRG